MWDTAGEVGVNSQVTYSSGLPHMDEQRQDDQLGPTYNSSVLIQDVALKTYRKQWTIEKVWKGSGISVLVVWHDEDDDALGTVTKGLLKGTGWLGNNRTSGDYTNFCIIENNQNAEKIPIQPLCHWQYEA